MPRKVTFNRDGLTLVGHLFTPENFDENAQYQAVIVQGSLSSVKEQMPDTYARKFAERGFIALAFDYSHYGESAGEPRQLEAPDEKLLDLQAAMSYLLHLPYVQAVGMVGICTSAGNAAYLATTDERLGALATVAASLPSPALYHKLIGEEGFEQRRNRGKEARRHYEETGEVEFVSFYSEDDPRAINVNNRAGAYDYYLNEARGNVPQYRNEAALMSLEALMDFDPLSQAPSIAVPTMVVHSDGSAFPDQARTFYDALQSEKELVWADGNHFDYYDSPVQINNAVEQIARFFRTHLNEQGALQR